MSAARTPLWYVVGCVVMFAAAPVGILLLHLGEREPGYWSLGLCGALECFFMGWFVGRSPRV